jgi:CheY-like chemotaxis protein
MTAVRVLILMKKVLVVDDQPDCSEPMARLLRVCGFEAATAGDGRAALETLGHGFGADAVVLDLAMPGMDGFEFLRALRGMPQWSDLPVVVFSAFYNDQMHSGLRLLGVTDVFSKGHTDFDHLINRLSEIMGEKQAVGVGRRVLLVEADEQTREALVRLLRDYGYEVLGVGTTAEAMKEAAEKEFDLAVVDLGVGEWESTKLLQVLLGKKECKSLGLKGQGAGAKGEGFSKVIWKPVEAEQLMEAIKGLTE